MKIEIYLKARMESLWITTRNTVQRYPNCSRAICLRCGTLLEPELEHNSKSKYVNAWICNYCGEDESIRYYANDPLPLHEWQAAISSRAQCAVTPETAYLSSICDPSHVSKITKMVPTRSVPIPVNEVAYSRSNFEAGQWQTSWEKYYNKNFQATPLNEIYDFHDALLALPEMENLATMGQLKKYAAPNGDSYDFEMYSETEHFYIWMIFSLHREKTNLHIHYYKKE